MRWPRANQSDFLDSDEAGTILPARKYTQRRRAGQRPAAARLPTLPPQLPRLPLGDQRLSPRRRRPPVAIRPGEPGWPPPHQGRRQGRAGRARPPLTLLQLHIKLLNLIANVAH